jgi:uncharacterized protein (DUF697 family)/GTP-binding protein EngB required for normal cell division
MDMNEADVSLHTREPGDAPGADHADSAAMALASLASWSDTPAMFAASTEAKLSFVTSSPLGHTSALGQHDSTAHGGLLRMLPGELAMSPPEGGNGGFDSASIEPLLRETSRHLRSIGRVNIVVAGQTGVGKSSLINAVFGETFARTASGRPVTQTAEWFSSDKIPLRVLDTKGLEAKDYTGTVNDLRAEIEASRAMKDARDQLHIGWVCIAAPSSRVQDAEIDVIRVLNRYDIPTIVVLTKYDDDEDFIDVVDQVLAERRVKRHAIVPVRSVAKKNRPPVGLSELVMATFRALPAAHRAAFAASQKVNLDLNREAANEYVTAAAAAAAAAAVIPLPLADALTLAPIQTGMLVGVSAAFGLSLERQQIIQLMGTVMGALALSVAGRWAVGSALKLIPGPGTVIGSVVNAGIAGTLTLTLGRAYISFLYAFIAENGRVPLADEIVKTFPTYYKKYSKLRDKAE